MALYKTSWDIVVKHSRMFSIIGKKKTQSWFKSIKELPIFDSLEETSSLTNEQWTNLRGEIIKSNTGIRIPSLDTIIIQVCINLKNLDLGQSYIKYMEENKYEISTALMGKYLQLMFNCRDNLTDAERNEILSIYDNLRLKHPLLDALTAESCILAISLTKRWKETLELLEMIKISCIASAPCYSAIIVASFKNGDTEIGWKYLNEMIQSRKKPSSEVYITYINYCTKNFQKPNICIEEVGKLFNFIAENDLMPDEIVMKEIKRIFDELGWVGTFTTLNTAGVCQKCQHQLEPLKLSEDDFSQLSQTVLGKVLVGNDVYFNSTPDELKRFVNFVNKTKPYDVVVDGLNVAYKNKKHTGSNAAQQVATVVRYFLDKNQIVLVLGRKHMSRWEPHSMNYIKKNSFLFLADDLSADDPYLLYATLASGPETIFVSSDLMRQHKFLLQDRALQKLFKRWQMSHQCSVSFNRAKLQLVMPLHYLPVAQKGENCWHIPYRLVEGSLSESYEPPDEWLCLEKVKKNHL